jgi:hypothetical protein
MQPGPPDRDAPATRVVPTVPAPPPPSSPSSTAARERPHAAPRAGVPPVLVAGLAALVLLVGATGLYFATRKPAEPSPSPAASPTPAPPVVPPVAGSGTLVVDALPWGEITAVVDAKGTRHPLSAAARYTPVALQLAPGEYTIELKNPSFPKPVLVKAQVRASGTETRVAEFRRIDAAAYLKKAGLTP